MNRAILGNVRLAKTDMILNLGVKLEELRRQIAIGIQQADRGELLPFDIEAIKNEARQRLKTQRGDRLKQTPEIKLPSTLDSRAGSMPS